MRGDYRETMMAVTAFELIGEFEKAEKALKSYMASLDVSDEEYRGALFIDLGQIVEQGGRPEEAVRYYSNAIQLLTGRKGDAQLQLAHANWNIALVRYKSKGYRDCLTHAEDAAQIYSVSPLATAWELWAATALVWLTQRNMSPIGPSDFHRAKMLISDLWKYKNVEDNLNIVREFLVLYIIHSRLEKRDLRKFYRDFFSWNAEIANEILNVVRRGMIDHQLSRVADEDESSIDSRRQYRSEFSDAEWRDIERVTVGFVLLALKHLPASPERRACDERLLVNGNCESPSALVREIFLGLANRDAFSVLFESSKLTIEQHERTKTVLREILSNEEFERFSGALFAEIWNIAMICEGVISEEYGQVLAALASYLNIDIPSIPGELFERSTINSDEFIAGLQELVELHKALESLPDNGGK